MSAPIGAPVAAVAPGTSPSTNDSADDAPLGAGTLRALIVAAWSHAGVDHDEVTADLAARARASALVPHLSFRVRRGADIAARVYTYSSSDTRDHTSASDTTLTFFETRLAWNLDRLVFATEEISLERLKLQRAELKQRIAAKVIELALRWQRARRASVDPNLLAVERAEAAVVTLEASLALEAYTGGGSAKLLSP